MKSLRTKFLVLVLVPVLLIFAIIGSYVVYNVYNKQTQSAVEMTESLTLLYASEIEREIDGAFHVVNSLAKLIEGQLKGGVADRHTLLLSLQTLLESHAEVNGLWLGFEANAFDGSDYAYKNQAGHDQTGRFIPHFYWENGQVRQTYLLDYTDPDLGAYYQDALLTGKPQLLEPFNYKVGGKEILLTTIAVPIKYEGKVVGVAGIDLSTEYISEVASQLEIYTNGFGRVMTDTGMMVYHPQQERIATIGEEFQDKDGLQLLQEARSGLTSAWNYAPALKTQSFKTYAPIQIEEIETKWIFGAVVQEDEMYAETVSLVLRMLIMILIGLLFLIAAIVIVSGTITKPISTVILFIEKVSGLDLKSEHLQFVNPYLQRKDEIGLMARALLTMHTALSEVTTQLQEIALRVAEGSGEIAASVNENSAAIEEVTSSMAELGNNVARTQEDSLTMDTDAKSVENLAENGLTQMTETLSAMEEIVQLSRGSRESLATLSTQASNMESVLKLIGDIAEQTNLLALNAAIEAARAGEHGRGFAVVADEVRQLAEQTQTSVGEIQKMVIALINGASDSTELMDQTEGKINLGSALLIQTEATFNQIAENISAVGGSIQNFAQALDAMHDMSSSVAAAAQEQAASMGEIAHNTGGLADLGQELQNIASRFII